MLLEEVTATSVALSAGLAARCGNAEDRISNCRSVSNTPVVSIVAFCTEWCTEALSSVTLITKSKLTILANFLVIVRFLDVAWK